MKSCSLYCFCYVIVLVAVGMGLPVKAQSYQIEIKDQSSLVRVGMDPHPTDSTDISLAYTLLGAFDNNNLDSIAYVRDRWYEKSLANLTKDKAYSSLENLLSTYLLKRSGRKIPEQDMLTEDLYTYFMGDGCTRLKEYLVLKYELNNYRPRSVKEYIRQRTFYEDMLMFNDPNRSTWDKTDEILRAIPLRQGDKIVDVGCGFGYNSWRFSQVVGETGMVYATDTESAYIDYFSDLLKRKNVSNIRPITSTSNNLSVNDSVDVIFMSSLYHIIYTWSREDERTPFLKSIKECLKQGGYVVVVDNIGLHGKELNNCHVNPKLVEAQLGFWGFEPVSNVNLSDQRYMLVFRRNDNYCPDVTVSHSTSHPVLTVSGRKSVIHIGSLDSYDITDRGIDAAQYVYDYMGNGQTELADIAIEKYKELIPMENFGGEYSALQWLCEVKKADQEIREEMLKDRLSRSFYEKLTGDSCKVIRYYLLHKYKLGNDSIRMLSDSILEKSGEVGRTHRSYLEDYILALNPRRPQWEQTDSLIAHLGIRKKETIADIGCGSGFFTDKFSRLVGTEGKVYAIEIKDEHINTLQEFLDKESIGNVSVIKGKEDVLELPEQVDKMFMCSLYHVLYGVNADDDRDKYLRSLVKLLKKDGELIIVDNGPVDDDTLPYHGPYISRELIAYQLQFYGFKLVEYYQIIPQRYMLKFKLSN